VSYIYLVGVLEIFDRCLDYIVRFLELYDGCNLNIWWVSWRYFMLVIEIFDGSRGDI